MTADKGKETGASARGPLGASVTSALAGKGGSVTGANSASEVRSWSATITAEVLDCTSFESDGWFDGIVGIEGGTGSLECVGTRPTNGSAAALSLKTAAAGGNTISGEAIFSNVETTVNVNEEVVHSAEFTFVGEVSVS